MGGKAQPHRIDVGIRSAGKDFSQGLGVRRCVNRVTLQRRIQGVLEPETGAGTPENFFNIHLATA